MNTLQWLKENRIKIMLNTPKKVTFLAQFKKSLTTLIVFSSVSFCATLNLSAAIIDPIKPNHKPQITDYKLPEIKPATTSYTLSASVAITRSTSLYDFNDGTRSDGLGVSFAPALTTPIGKFTLKESYSKNLNDPNSASNGFSDASLTYSFGAKDWSWSPPYVLTMSPSLTAIVPISEISVKKNEMQTALIGSLAFGIRPDGLVAQNDGMWSAGVTITAGRSFHAYQEDITGAILNKYLSNQGFTIGYGISDWGFSFNYTNRSRWTYDNDIKQSYVTTQEVSYKINDHFNTAIGHSNDAASVFKENGYESNIQLIDEKNSSVYLTLISSF